MRDAYTGNDPIDYAQQVVAGDRTIDMNRDLDGVDSAKGAYKSSLTNSMRGISSNNAPPGLSNNKREMEMEKEKSEAPSSLTEDKAKMKAKNMRNEFESEGDMTELLATMEELSGHEETVVRELTNDVVEGSTKEREASIRVICENPRHKQRQG